MDQPNDPQQHLEANKQKILALMRDPRYRYTLGFYPDRIGTEYGCNQLPDLSWKIKTLRIHPGGTLSTSHWRLSLITADGKRTFFNNNVEYLLHGYGQMRVGPGRENNEAVTFDLELASEQRTLGEYLDVVLHPTVAGDGEGGNYDGVYEDQPMCWFLYTNYVKRQTNFECRHWVQAVVRAFWRKGMLKEEPTPVFRMKNIELGYANDKGECPKGEFFKEKPTDLKSTLKGNEEQEALERGEL